MKSLGFLCLFAILACTLTLAQANPVPFINQPLVPDATAPGGKGFTLTVNGTDFVSGSVVNWSGSALATTFVSGSQLTATVPASNIAKANTASVTVLNPSPGGGTSNVVFFEVTPSSPSTALGAASQFGVGRTPTWVATADLNGDGKLDLAVANAGDTGQGSKTVSILLGNGDGTFQTHVDYVAGSGPYSVAVGDFNGDGKMDLAVANGISNDVSILLGYGDGTFHTAVNYPVASGVGAIALGDFNGDGKLDLAVTGLNAVSILFGNGDGTFQAAVPTTLAQTPFSLAVGDFNNDGKLDLAVANYIADSVSVLLGNGDGTFQAAMNYAAGTNPIWLATGDFNDDGKLDLAVANVSSNDVSILLGNGDGTFQPAANHPAGTNPYSVAVADFNGDGKLDLTVSNQSDVSVLLGNGDGTFQAPLSFSTPLCCGTSVVVGDFNRDGRLDVALPIPTNLLNAVFVLLQIPTVTLSPPNVDFGAQLLGSKSPAHKIILTNFGPGTVSINSIVITGPDGGDFGEKHNCRSSLPPGAHCAIRVTFAPKRVGPRMAAVTITDDASGSPQSVPLSGIGVSSGPNATLSTRHLDFATRFVGTRSPAKPVQLSNYGTATLNITSIVASGDFGKKDNCGSRLPPEGSCTIDVTFAPTRVGHRVGTLTITDNAPDSPQKVRLMGVGTVVKLEPSSLDFGTVTVGQKSSPQNTRLTNVGRTRLQITGITITGTDSGDFFIQQTTCPNPGYLGGGKSCTMTVIFQPTQGGPRSADVSVSDDGGGSPQQVSLSGTGQSKCSGRCGRGCGQGCRCIFGFCRAAGLPTISGTLDTLWDKETASQPACAARPAIAFACQE